MKIADYEVPEDLYYADYLFWCRPEGDEVVIGMDDFAQRLAGDIVFVQLPFVGKAVTRGKKLSKVESGKWLGTVYGPADGEITAVNEELEENPGLINEDCYGKGWMYRMRPADMGQIESLRHGGKDVLEPWIMQDVEKYKQD